MFAAHRIVPLEERARARGRGVCADHGEAFILFSTDTRELVCINCFKAASLESRHHYVDLDVAHKIGCEKLDKVTTKLKVFQQDVREQMQLRRRLLNELDDSFKAQDAQVRQTCQQMIDGLMQVRDRLLQELDADRRTRESHFNDQLKNLCAMLPSIHLYLLSSSIFCASASKIDFLDSAHDLIKRIQNLTGDGGQLSKPLYTGQLSSDSREEYARALEPFLGLSSLLLTRGSGRSGSDANGVDCSGTISPRRCSRRSGSGYVNCPNALAMSKYQLIVDLAGAFGEEFARIETPVRLLAHQMSALTKETQELQRDLTLRRCLIDKVRVNELIARCVDVDTKLATHSALIQDTQPQLQHIWQEQLDRVRRQQQLFREKVEQTVQLREDARHVSAVARQLEPFALSLAAAASLIDPRRCHPPDPAPMERICLEINTIAPDSQHRIEAIEKEEHNRKMVMEQKKREETNELMSAKRQLKMTKEHRKSGKATAVDGRVVRNVGRDRSRGGTDQALLSPTKRKERNSPAVSPRPVSDDQSSATDEFESSMDDSFEFTASEASASVEIVQRREIRLLRSKT
uniref:Actin interacting protein 3-like C-terminal domain-containing protein n=1 Tax=Plectus sambesii TaxID=2011161 RepID=A0A914WHR3_9BILA